MGAEGKATTIHDLRCIRGLAAFRSTFAPRPDPLPGPPTQALLLASTPIVKQGAGPRGHALLRNRKLGTKSEEAAGRLTGPPFCCSKLRHVDIRAYVLSLGATARRYLPCDQVGLHPLPCSLLGLIVQVDPGGHRYQATWQAAFSVVSQTDP
jgi:hypothetical protein